MQESYLQLLCCPYCYAGIKIKSITNMKGIIIEGAQLICHDCNAEYPVIRGIPRFVPYENYASNFGLEWMRHSRTQYDSYTGLKLSEKRFFESTQWPRDLSGQVVLEVGSGSGRFTEQAASTNAFVVSTDMSYAVEANYQSNGKKPNVFIVQADVFNMPFKVGFFGKLFCFGVLQHTPDPHKAFLALPPMLKPGGTLAIDVYKKTFFSTFLASKYYIRFLTRKVEPEKLYRLTKRWVDLMWPLFTQIAKIPRIGHSINWRLLVADYGKSGLKGNLLKEWSYLDTFDMLSPRYDFPQSIKNVRNWFAEANLVDCNIQYGHNGIEGRGRKPMK